MLKLLNWSTLEYKNNPNSTDMLTLQKDNLVFKEISNYKNLEKIILSVHGCNR